MRYVTKPEYVEAIQWTGHNVDECKKITGDEVVYSKINSSIALYRLFMPSPNGDINIWKGDYIIKHQDGSISTMSGENFEKVYKKVGDDNSESSI